MSSRPAQVPVGHAKEDRLKAVLAAGLARAPAPIEAPQDKAKPFPSVKTVLFGPSKAKKELEELKAGKAKCDADLRAMSNEAARNGERFRKANTDVAAMKIERAKILSELEAAKKHVQSASRAAIAKLQESKLSNEELGKISAELQQVSQMYNGAVATLQQQDASAQLMQDQNRQAIGDLQTSLVRMQQENKDVIEREAALKARLASLESALQGVEDPSVLEAYRRVEEENEAFFREAEQLQQQTTNMTQSVSVTVNVFGGLEASIEELKATVKRLEAEIQGLRADLAASTNDIIDEIKKQALNFTQGELDGLNSIIAMTNPERFGALLRIACIRQDIDTAVQLSKYKADPHGGGKPADSDIDPVATDLPSALVTVLTTYPKNYKDGFLPHVFKHTVFGAYDMSNKDVEGAKTILRAMASAGARLSNVSPNGWGRMSIPTWELVATFHVELVVLAYKLGIIDDQQSIPIETQGTYPIKLGDVDSTRVSYLLNLFLGMTQGFSLGGNAVFDAFFNDFLPVFDNPQLASKYQLYTPGPPDGPIGRGRRAACITQAVALMELGARDPLIPSMLQAVIDQNATIGVATDEYGNARLGRVHKLGPTEPSSAKLALGLYNRLAAA